MSAEFQPTLVSSMEDIIRILEEQPIWADRMRGIILGKELLALPAQFRAFAEKVNQDIEELKQGHEELKQGQKELKQGYDELKQGYDELKQGHEELKQGHEELKQGQKALQDDMGHLKGISYENKAATRLSTLMPRATGYTRIRVIKSNTVSESENLIETLESAIESGAATEDEVISIRLADIIASARESATGKWGYVVCEASTTLKEDDVERAAARANALRKAAQAPAIPVVIGPAIQPDLQEIAAQAGVLVAIMQL